MSSGTVRPEVVAKTLREHNAERERLAQLHEKSEEEHKRQLSNMRHVESVAILIKEHDAKAEEHERKLIDQNERSLALEKQTTRELSKNFEKSKNDVERLNVCVFFLVDFTFSGRTFNSFDNCFVHVAAHALFFD